MTSAGIALREAREQQARIRQLDQEMQRLAIAVDAVLELHHQIGDDDAVGYFCAHCARSWPCPTARACGIESA